jgi:membrane protein DedA with SNARE-associated domain
MRNQPEAGTEGRKQQPSPDSPRWRRWLPWQGPATRADAALMAAIGGVILFGFAVRTARPFLIASHPVLLEFLNGGAAEIGAAAAYARVGGLPLWLVVVAGTIGMMKLDWLTWWAGRRWGPGIVGYFTTRERAERLTDRARQLPPWMLRLAVIAAALPGVPSGLITTLAGWTGMRLPAFLALDALGALLATSLVTALGYLLGQRAIDVVLLVERYAGWVTLGILVVTLGWPFLRRMLRGRA